MQSDQERIGAELGITFEELRKDVQSKCKKDIKLIKLIKIY